MRVLLDTHTFLWFLMDSPQLSDEARRLIQDVDNERFLSVASLWEIAIKVSVGRLSLEQSFEALFPRHLDLNSIEPLDITIGHISAVATLPLHHRDPFDRLLVAQAALEAMPIISRDAAFDAYAVTRLWEARPHSQ